MDWPWYIGASLAGMVGVSLLAWSLFADRSRGRLRCPRCWYQIAPRVETLPITCPECGRSVAKFSHLRRTHRRWRWALVAVCTCVIAPALGAAPAVRRSGWARYAPTTVLILAYSHADSPADEVIKQLDSRFKINENWGVVESVNLRPWQETLLAKQCAAVLRDESAGKKMRNHALGLLVALGPRALPAIDELIATIEANGEYEMYSALRAIQAIAPQGRRAIPALIAVLTRPGAQDEYYTDTAVDALGAYIPAPAEAVEPLLDLMQREMRTYSSESLKDSIVRTLGRIGPEAIAALPYLFEQIKDTAPLTRAVHVESIGLIDPLHAESRRLIFDGLLHAEVHVRAASAEITRRHPQLLGPSLERLTTDLQSESSAVRLAAARALSSLGPGAAPARDLLVVACADENRSVRLFAVEALWSLAETEPTAAARLQSLAVDPDVVVARAARRRLPR